MDAILDVVASWKALNICASFLSLIIIIKITVPHIYIQTKMHVCTYISGNKLTGLSQIQT